MNICMKRGTFEGTDTKGLEPGPSYSAVGSPFLYGACMVYPVLSGLPIRGYLYCQGRKKGKGGTENTISFSCQGECAGRLQGADTEKAAWARIPFGRWGIDPPPIGEDQMKKHSMWRAKFPRSHIPAHCLQHLSSRPHIKTSLELPLVCIQIALRQVGSARMIKPQTVLDAGSWCALLLYIQVKGPYRR